MAGIRKTAPTIETERLRLRAFRASDLKALHALYTDGDNLRYWGVDRTGSLDETRRMMRWHVAYHPWQYVLWAVEDKKSKRLIGMINYHRRDRRERRVDVGWMIEPSRQGKGYMTEAGRALVRYLIDTLAVHKVEALIRPENKPSAALAKRLGFRLEGGPIRDRWWVGKQWHSVMLYGLIAGEEK
ncbi:MAG: GNAT family N-acetyltransferase [Reyranella sp.]|uniref:GNAT family N-acetyltransferase n=1 Tax=Reyranella sp. TaxID=1929291 RepID=UPI001ACB920E|nr:GNAT family protein [Reyranella sp.]MBN9086047.1 GNAT family N-acetyltransferase [Reyranella sp.]